MDKVEVTFPKPPKPSALPQTTEGRAVVLVDLMERLALHIDAETAAVAKRRRNAELAAIAKDKQPIALVFEEVSRLLRVDREGLAALPDDLKGRLKGASQALARAASDNALRLRRSAEGQTKLVDTLVTSVNRARRQDHPSYTPAAAGYVSAVRGGPARHGPATAATLNTKL